LHQLSFQSGKSHEHKNENIKTLQSPLVNPSVVEAEGKHNSDEEIKSVAVKSLNRLGAETDGVRHILIVDDEPVNLKVLRNHLEGEGYIVTQASDGQEALQILDNSNPFHLVLLDVMMPRIPGYEVCQKIREKYLMTELPVIMVTAKNQVSDLVEGLTIGANDYIIKPFSKDELLARVKNAIV
jgi:CheY-like chemotaxis protein